MPSIRKYITLLVVCLGAGCACAEDQQPVTAVLPNGRLIRPVGKWTPLAPYPFAIAVNPREAQIAIPSIGFPFALNVIQDPDGPETSVLRKPEGRENAPEIEVHAGLAYAPDKPVLYVATGDSGKIHAYDTRDWKVVSERSLDGEDDGKDYQKSFAATLIVSQDGTKLFVLDQANWRVVVLKADGLQRIASIPTGAYPFGLALSPDEHRLYVTNTGLFEYVTVPGADQKDPIRTGLHFPPFGFPSKEAREGADVEGRKIPGLGDENSDRGSSLWTYDVSQAEHPRLTAKLRLGSKIDGAAGVVGGAAPTGVAANADGVFVTLAHDDSVVKASPDGERVLSQAELSPFIEARFKDRSGRPLRGVMPSGIAVHGGRVYVAESGINAVGVLDAASLSVLEHIPVGWNPSAVDLSRDGKFLYVVNTKGKGTGPNGGKQHDSNSPSYIGALEYGSLSVIALDQLATPDVLTRTVVETNTAALEHESKFPKLKHCFLVIRENRTFDEVLGDVDGANGDPSLARYGMDGWAAEDNSVKHLKVSPNLHALAQKFAIADNFSVDSDVSADGHRWVVGANPTPFFNTAWTSNYGGRRKDDVSAQQPGRRAIFGGADAPMPEDEPQYGTLWEHIARDGKGISNYGEGLEVEGNAEMDGTAPQGQRLFLNSPVPKPVFESTDRHYPTFNLGIPDQFRATEFERDFSRRITQKTLPSLIVIRLPADHTMEPRPGDGYPYRASYVADNDLALGRIVAFLSRTPIWKDSALFVTEDDAQGGIDHVDAHRSILLVASPWLKPGSISHTHTSMGSITKTIDELLGIGSLNLEDALAGEITGIFDEQPHLQPFLVQPSDPRIFVPAKARIARPKTKKEAAALVDMDDAREIQKEMEHSVRRMSRPKDED